MTQQAIAHRFNVLIQQLTASLPGHTVKPITPDSNKYKITAPGGAPSMTMDCSPGDEEAIRLKTYLTKLQQTFGWTPAAYHRQHLAEEGQIKTALASGSAAILNLTPEEAAARMEAAAEAELRLAKRAVRRTIILDNVIARDMLASHLEALQKRDMKVGDELDSEQVESILKGHTYLRQRKADKDTVSTIMQSMIEGEWYWTGDAITVADDGFILNGLQRLLSVYGVPNGKICTDVIANVANKVWIVLDTGRPRRSVDTLKSLGLVDPATLKSILALLLRYDGKVANTDRDDWMSWNSTREKAQTIGSYAMRNKNELQSSRLIAKRVYHRVRDQDSPSPSVAALGAAHYILTRDTDKGSYYWETWLAEAVEGDQGAFAAHATTRAVEEMLKSHHERLVPRPATHRNAVHGRFPRAVEQLVILLDAAHHEIGSIHYDAKLTEETPLRRFTRDDTHA
jgi:hypothetical protein